MMHLFITEHNTSPKFYYRTQQSQIQKYTSEHIKTISQVKLSLLLYTLYSSDVSASLKSCSGIISIAYDTSGKY